MDPILNGAFTVGDYSFTLKAYKTADNYRIVLGDAKGTLSTGIELDRSDPATDPMGFVADCLEAAAAIKADNP